MSPFFPPPLCCELQVRSLIIVSPAVGFSLPVEYLGYYYVYVEKIYSDFGGDKTRCNLNKNENDNMLEYQAWRWNLCWCSLYFTLLSLDRGETHCAFATCFRTFSSLNSTMQQTYPYLPYPRPLCGTGASWTWTTIWSSFFHGFVGGGKYRTVQRARALAFASLQQVDLPRRTANRLD